MDRKICSMCNVEKHIEDFYKKYSECENCNSKRGVKRYYKNKDEKPNQRKIYYEKNKETILETK